MNCISDWSLVGFVSIWVVLDLIICVLWSGFDPFILDKTETLDEQNTMPVQIVKEFCKSNYPLYWLIALITPKTIITLASFLLALSTHMDRK